MTQVQSPTGDILEFPDNMSEAEILGVMRKHFGGPMTAGDTAVDSAQGLGTGLVKGTMGLATAPRSMVDHAIHGAEFLADRYLPASVSRDTIKNVAEGASQAAGKIPMIGPRYEDFAKTLESATGPLPEPKSLPGQFLQTTGEFLPGAMAGGGGIAGNALRYGVAPALASESAAHIPGVQGSAAEPWVRAGTALATGGAAAGLARPRNAEAALGPAMQNIDRPTLEAAQALMAEATGRGINLSWPQAVAQVADGAKPLQQLQRFVERTPTGGPPMASFYEGQPQAIRGAVTRELDNVAQAPANPYVVGPQAAESAKGALEGVNRTINDYTRDMYRDSAHAFVRDANTKANTYQKYLDEIRNDQILGDLLPKGPGNAPIANFPPHSVAMIDAVKKLGDQTAQGMRASIDKPDRLRAAIIESELGKAVGAARAQVPAYDNALALQQFGRSQILEPLQQGPLGRVANAGSTEQATAALFDPKLAGGENQIRRAVVNMESQQPGTGAALTRQYLADKANAAGAGLVGGENYYGGARFAKDVFGNPQSAADVRAAVGGTPGGGAANDSMSRLVEALRATGKRLPEGSQTATDLGLADAIKTTQGPVAKALSLITQPGKLATSAIDDTYGAWRIKKTAADLARILQDPNEIELLSRVAGQGRGGSNAVAILANALMAGQTSSQPRR